jgi:hypothetical protein
MPKAKGNLTDELLAAYEARITSIDKTISMLAQNRLIAGDKWTDGMLLYWIGEKERLLSHRPAQVAKGVSNDRGTNRRI